MFLDLGDTLMHIHPDVPTLYLQALAELGVVAVAATVGDALLQGEHLYRAALRSGRPFESSIAEARAFWGEYNERILGAVGVPAGPARADLAGTLSERFWSPQAWRVFPEVHEVLTALRGAGLRLAVISNFTDALVAVCETHDLDGYFDTLIASATHGAQKPDISIFREALRRTGSAPDACVHVGDNYVADVLGARAAGIAPILIDRSLAGRPGMYDFTVREGLGSTVEVSVDCPVISDLRELLALVA